MSDIKQARIDKMNEKASIEEQILRLQNGIDNCLLEQGKFFAERMMDKAKNSLVNYGKATGYVVCLYPDDLKEFGIWENILEIDRLKSGAHRDGTVYLTTVPRMFDNPYFTVDSDLIFKLVEKAMLDHEIHIKQKMVDICGRVEGRFEMKVMM